MRQGNWSRPISGPGFFVHENRTDAQNNIDHNVLLCLSTILQRVEKSDCADGINFQNDFNASVQHNHPKNSLLGLLCNHNILTTVKEIDSAK